MIRKLDGRCWTAGVLAAALAALPGLSPWASAGEQRSSAPHGTPSVPLVSAGARLDPKAVSTTSVPAGLGRTALPQVSGVAPAAAAAGVAPIAVDRIAVDNPQSDPATALGGLENGMARVEDTSTPDERREGLDSIYLHGRARGAALEIAAGPNGSAPSPRAPATLKPAGPIAGIKKAAVPLLLGIGAIWGLDAATKAFALTHLETAFHEAAWRLPLLSVIVPFIMYTAFKARKELPDRRSVWHWSWSQRANGRFGFYKGDIAGANELAEARPAVERMVALYDVSIALMIGGALGNFVDLARLGGALDWIPVGRSLLNFADVALLTGLAYFQLATSFFVKAGEARANGKALNFNLLGYLAVPIAGFFAAWTFGSIPGDEILHLVLKNMFWVYVLGFSMLLGISRVVAAMFFAPHLQGYLDPPPKRLP